jgi:glycosyltransferase involved in cell wall biosynthesis
VAEAERTHSRNAGQRRRGPKTLLPVFYGAVDPSLVPLAQALSDGPQVYLLGVVPVEQGKSLSRATPKARELRTALRRVAADTGARLAPKIVVSYDPCSEITSFITKRGIDLLVLDWPEDSDKQKIVQATWDYCACAAALLRGRFDLPAKGALLLLRPGIDSELGLRLGLNLRRNAGVKLSTLRPTAPADDLLTSDSAVALEQVIEHLPEVEDTILMADDPLAAVFEQASGASLMIVGASQAGRELEPGLDPFARPVFGQTSTPVLVTRAAPADVPIIPEETGGIEAISILVDKWFAENTFDSSEFANLERLLRRKAIQGVTISLALPALNEEETIENVLLSVRRALMDEVPLLDEIVLIDSNSTDRTREIASDLGIPVFIHQEILPQYGARHGKGEALWKSLYVTRGDIILWIDTDIVNIHPRFVYGLIGPLLFRPDLMFVKGFYLRPMRVGNTIQAGGGGRVTELTARPLLNLFYPALSGLVQPLSGEYGGRRAALERLPFSSGYGVEIGLLIDILDEYGLGAIGQVDLVQRVHHNQPLAALSKMSFAIIQTVFRRLDARDGLQRLENVNRSMKLIRHEASRFFLEVAEIAERERPPMATLPEYRARHPEESD